MTTSEQDAKDIEFYARLICQGCNLNPDAYSAKAAANGHSIPEWMFFQEAARKVLQEGPYNLRMHVAMQVRASILDMIDKLRTDVAEVTIPTAITEYPTNDPAKEHSKLQLAEAFNDIAKRALDQLIIAVGDFHWLNNNPTLQQRIATDDHLPGGLMNKVEGDALEHARVLQELCAEYRKLYRQLKS